MAFFHRSRILSLAVAVLLLIGYTAAADGLNLRDQIVQNLATAAQPKATKAPTSVKLTGSPTPKPTKVTLSPTVKVTNSPTAFPTKKTASPTSKTKSPVPATASPAEKSTGTQNKIATEKPTKAPRESASPTKKPTKAPRGSASPTKRPTKEPAAASETASPTRKVAKTKSPVAAGTKTPTNAPTASVVGANSNTSKAPSASKKTTTVPSAANLKSTIVAGIQTSTGSPTSAETGTNAPTDASAMNTFSPTSTLSPTSEPAAEDSAANDIVTNTPSSSSVVDTSSPSVSSGEVSESPVTASGAESNVNETSSPSEFPEASPSPTTAASEETPSPTLTEETANSTPTASETASPSDSDSVVPPVNESVATTTPSGAVILPTASPSSLLSTNATSSTSDADGTASPSSTGENTTSPSSNDDHTGSPTLERNDTAATTVDGNGSGNSTATPSTAPAFEYSNLTATNSSSSIQELNSWKSKSQHQLYLAKVMGVNSRTAAGNAALALERICSLRTDNATAGLTTAISEIETTVLPGLKANRSACIELLKQPEAEQDRALREKLEFASSSSAMAIKAQEKLANVCLKILNGTSCDNLVNSQLLDSKQYDVQTEMDTINNTNIILASLALVLSLILMVMHPVIDGWGSCLVFVIGGSYVWGYAAFMGGWYAFQLNEVSSWVASTWWRDFYSVYLMGLAGWLLFWCLLMMLYSTMLRNPWLLGVFAGIAVGAVFGIQVNTIGAWTLGKSAQLPEYLTHACCMGAGAALFAFVFGLWSGLRPSTGGMQHLVAMFVGSYLFVKSIGVLVGSYPNEFNMELPETWETYVYTSCMWVLFLVLLVFQTLVYGVFTPVQVAVSQPPRRPSSQSMRKKEYMEEEKVPLLTDSVGSAADARNKLRQQEVVEFGGIRALRSEQENRKLFV